MRVVMGTNALTCRVLTKQSQRVQSTQLWEVVVAQLAERSLTMPEDPGLNPVISNFYFNIYLLLTVCRKDENKKKRPSLNKTK